MAKRTTKYTIQGALNLALIDLGSDQYGLSICNPDGSALFSGGISFGDDVKLNFGATPDAYIQWETGSPRLQIYSISDAIDIIGDDNLFNIQVGDTRIEMWATGAGPKYNQIYIDGDITVFNEYSEDVDFRIESVSDQNCFMVDGGNENVSIKGASLSVHYDLALLGAGVLCLKEGATPTADTNYGKIYCKNTNELFFQDGAGAEHKLAFA